MTRLKFFWGINVFICLMLLISKLFAEHFMTTSMLNIRKEVFCFIIRHPCYIYSAITSCHKKSYGHTLRNTKGVTMSGFLNSVQAEKDFDK